MFVTEDEDVHGVAYTYGHCEGCGMEYELYDSGRLNYWHDGVGLVAVEYIPDETVWDNIVASHDIHEGM